MSNPHPPFFPMLILRRAALALLCAYLLLPSSHSVYAQVPTATISGRVTNSKGEPVVNVWVNLYRNRSTGTTGGPQAQTNANGEYVINNVTTDTYYIRFLSPSTRYLTEFSNDQPSIALAEGVYIQSGENLTGYDAELADAGYIMGKTVNSNGEAIGGVKVQASYRAAFGYYEPAGEMTTNANGEFVYYLGDKSTQYLFFIPPDPYFREYYNNKFTIESATPISVGKGEVLTLTVPLERKHSVSGTATDIKGQALPDILVYLYDTRNSNPLASTHTDELGNFQFDLLANADYRLEFLGGQTLSEFYKDKPVFEESDIFTLRGDGDLFVANVVLNRNGVISGTVTNIYGVPLERADVYAYIEKDGEWGFYWSTRLDEFGNYRYYSNLWEESDFRLQFMADGYVQEFYGDSPTVEAGQSVSVAADTIVTNTNVMLRKHDEVEADFSGTPRTDVGSLTTDFANLAKGDVVTQTWDFGDGVTSTEISPTHTYTQAGVYTVTLTVVGPQNRHTKSASGYISVTDVPIMDLAIEMDEQVGTVDAPAMVGETLHFSATAGGTGVQYLWDFGDETAIVASVATTATGQYVQHAYTAAGTYTVTLTASNSGSEETTTHEVTVIGAPSAESTLLLPKLER